MILRAFASHESDFVVMQRNLAKCMATATSIRCSICLHSHLLQTMTHAEKKVPYKQTVTTES